MSIQLVLQLLGGIGIFLFAIKLISDSLQVVAGDRLRYIISAMTKTPLLGVLAGTITTVLIQSSSATTVMTVSFVDAGLMSLRQAIGVIMGANIGTTVTGQIIAINIKDYVYVFVAAGALLLFLGKSKTQKAMGSGLIGFGLLFIGMQTMESSMSFLRSNSNFFLAFSSTPLLGILAGTILTLLVQSSSATVGLTIALATQGLLPLEAAIPIILGDNIGTTITAILASIGTNRAAKQACVAHILFNVVGVCIFYPFLSLYVDLISKTADSVAHQVANAHTLFNLINTCLFLPFVSYFVVFIRKLVPDQPVKKSTSSHLLDDKLINTSPVMAVDAIRHECAHMGFLVVSLMDSVFDVFFNKNKEAIDVAVSTEDTVNAIKSEIYIYSTDIWQAGISEGTSKLLTTYLGCVHYVEKAGDQTKKFLVYHTTCMGKSDRLGVSYDDFSEESLEEIKKMFLLTRSTMITSLDAFVNTDKIKALEVQDAANKVRRIERNLRSSYARRIGRKDCNVNADLLFVEMISSIEHIAYHANNLSKATLSILADR